MRKTKNNISSVPIGGKSASSRVFLLALFALVVYFFFLPTVLNSLPPAGDEEEYLRVMESLRADKDLFIENNTFYLNRPGERIKFFATEKSLKVIKKDGRLLPIHNIGLALATFPFYAVGGRFGVALAMCMIAALAVFQLAGLTGDITKNGTASAVASGAVGFSVPFFFYAFVIYPTMLSLLLQLTFIRTAIKAKNASLMEIFFAGTALALLPWLHYRMVFFVPFAVAVYIFFIGRKEITKIAVMAAPAIVSFAALAAFQYFVFGAFVLFSAEKSNFGHDLRGPIGLLFDQQYGLIVYAPFYFLAPAGMVLLFKEKKREFYFLSFFFLFNFAQFALHDRWEGDWSPAGRRHAEYIPLLAVPIAYGLGSVGARFYKTVFALLFILSACAAFVSASHPINLFINHGAGVNTLFRNFLFLSPAKNIFPSVIIGSAKDYMLCVAWAFAFVVINFVSVRSMLRKV